LKPKIYNTLTIESEFLNPGFCIYLLEIINSSKKRLFYIGMTGDNYYPSARSAFYRMAGHLEKKKGSTQNQFHKALKDVSANDTLLENSFSDKDGIYLKDVIFKMHQFKVEGFKSWEYGDGFNREYMSKLAANELDESKHYQVYRNSYNEVLDLERALISHFKDNLVNKDVRSKHETDHQKFEEMKIEIQGLIDSNTQ
jgi:hypothetical protein